MRKAITNVFVPGRGHALSAEGELCLSQSSIARADTAIEYYRRNRESFAGAYASRDGGYFPNYMKRLAIVTQVSKLLYGGFHSPRGLRMAEAFACIGASILPKPAAKYATTRYKTS